MNTTTKISDVLRSRINPAWAPHAQDVSKRALAAVDEIANRKATIAPGDKAALRDAVARHAGPMAAKAAADLSRAKNKLAIDRSELAQKAIAHSTPKDSEIAKEIRGHLRSIPAGDRLKILMGPDASLVAQRAVLEVPLFLSGVPSLEISNRILDDVLGKHFPNEVAALGVVAEAIDHADASVRLAKDELARGLDFATPAEFTKFFEAVKPAS